jgi:hypothetical protein
MCGSASTIGATRALGLSYSTREIGLTAGGGNPGRAFVASAARGACATVINRRPHKILSRGAGGKHCSPKPTKLQLKLKIELTSRRRHP